MVERLSDRPKSLPLRHCFSGVEKEASSKPSSRITNGEALMSCAKYQKKGTNLPSRPLSKAGGNKQPLHVIAAKLVQVSN